MADSKRDAIAFIGAIGAGVAGLWILRRALRKEDKNEIPTLKLPAGCYHPLQAVFSFAKDSLQYGTGRWILHSSDPKIGICKFFMLGQVTVVPRDPNLVEEILKQNYQRGGGYGKSFKGSPFDPLIDTSFGRGLFFADDQDPQWATAHKILTKPFSHRGILNMFPLICEQADKLIVALEREIKSSTPIYIYDYMVKMALETIAVCSMGTRFNSFDESEPHPFPVAFQKTLDAMLELLEVPIQFWPVCFRTKARMREHVGVMNKLIDEIVQQRIRGETCSSGKFPDLLDLMLVGENGSKLSDTNIRSQILTFLFAGHDSTAAAMSSFIVLMLANPRVEAKLVEEISQVVGDSELTAKHLSELTYLDWCLKETLRLLPPAGNYQRMSFLDDLMLGGKWKLARDTPIDIDIFALHMDPNTWGADAAHFVPERWEVGPPHPCSYMPFASGPRGCIGKEFSLMEQKIVAVKLLQKFVMRSPQNWCPRKGSVLIKASEPLAQPIIGIDAEFNPQQFFAGASVPVELEARAEAKPLISACGGA